MTIEHQYRSGGSYWRSIFSTPWVFSTWIGSCSFWEVRMLRRLSASDLRFKTVVFRPGLNLILADKTESSSATDTRNSAGKSSIIELLHFLLGASADRGSFFTRPPLREIVFRLDLDWPSTTDGLSVQRAGRQPGTIIVDPDVDGSSTPSLFGTATQLNLAEWQHRIERALFALPEQHEGVTGRTLLSFYMRRASANAFAEATRIYPRQSEVDASVNLAYLLGLDWQLAARYRELAAREAARRQLARAAADPVLGRIIGRSAELRGQITIAEDRTNKLEQQIREFRVVPQYEERQRAADELDRQIRASRAQDAIDRRNLQDLETAIEETAEPHVDTYLASVYGELGIHLPSDVRRSFDDVQSFHHSVIRNRRYYLDAELSALRQRLADRAAERRRLDGELASALGILQEGNALGALTTLQTALAGERAALEALRYRLEAAQALETSGREIAALRLEIQGAMQLDLQERRSVVEDAVLLYSHYATQLYGHDRRVHLEFDPQLTCLRIEPGIDQDESHGIGNMATFCFDLTLAVIAHRAGRGPDFLVHDSHIFDGVDERQLARALTLGRDVARTEGIQYIVTMNSDDLIKASSWTDRLDEQVIPPRLTDQYDDGGLFGFRI
jgi:uncharacterized protein YydD (DUF2326 family)